MSSMPAALAEVVSDFQDVHGQDKLQLLLEFANELPPLPADLEEAAMEPVPECQSPLFLHVDAADRDRVRLYFSAPAEAPTTRGFASILAAGLDKQSADGHPGGARRLLHRSGPRGADQSAAVARHVGDAGADQAATAGRVERLAVLPLKLRGDTFLKTFLREHAIRRRSA